MKKEFIVHLFHIIIIGALFLYVGIYKTKIPWFFYTLLLILGIFILLYHSYKVFLALSHGKNPWVNYIHIFIIAPVLIYIGLNKEKTPRFYFEILLMLGFASIGYHSYYLFLNS
jgi:hypothetical protein